MNVLIDSDVYLDFVLQRPPFEEDANQIFRFIADENFSAFVCAPDSDYGFLLHS